MFERERVYRRRDLHARYGGQQQGGIATPSGRPYIFLFTGTGEAHDYEDGWVEDGVFQYSGIGRTGDMEFKGVNRAIRDHLQDGKDLHLFTQVRDGEVRYMGCFACASWDHRLTRDSEGNLRRAITFFLIPIDTGPVPPPPPAAPEEIPLDDLKRRALKASAASPARRPAEARRQLLDRTAAVHTYVIARAGGVCEACDRPAPFRQPGGGAYLEPHHLHRAADFGPDHPRAIAALCPNCHREAHHGDRAADMAATLRARLEEHEGPPSAE